MEKNLAGRRCAALAETERHAEQFVATKLAYLQEKARRNQSRTPDGRIDQRCRELSRLGEHNRALMGFTRSLCQLSHLGLDATAKELEQGIIKRFVKATDEARAKGES